MLAVGAASAAMLNDGYVVTGDDPVRATIALPGGVYPNLTLALSDVQITAADTTSLPDQVHFATGARIMGASFTLAGPVDPTDDSKDAAWLFGRWQTSSPLWRTDAMYALVTLDVDLYPPGAGGVPDTVRCFTGVVDHYEAQDDGTVAMTCVDFSALFKSLPETPVVATAAPWNAGLTAEFARDAVLRAASKAAPMGLVSSWPATRPHAVLAAGLRTSLWAEVGALNTNTSTIAPTFVPGQWGSGVTGSAAWSEVDWTLASTVGDDGYFECAITVDRSLSAAGDFGLTLGNFSNEFASISGDTGPTVSLTLVAAGGIVATYTFPVTITAGPHMIGWSIHWPIGSTSYSSTLTVDGTLFLSGTHTAIAPRAARWTTGSLQLSKHTVVEALQATTETSPASHYPFTPTAVCDPSLNPLDVVPPIAANANPNDTLLQMNSAELGLGGFGPDGIYRFRNRNTLASQPVARTVTTLTGLTEETQAGAVINRAHVGWTNWSTGRAAVVWQAKGRWHIPARATGRNAYTAFVTLTGPAVNIPTGFTQLPTTGATTDGVNYFDSSLDRNGVTPDPNPPTITATPVSSQKVALKVVNADARDKWLVARSTVVSTTIDGTAVSVGDPLLLLGGQPLTAAGEAVADYQYPAADDGGAASSRFGEQLWELTGNPWIQDGDAARTLARDVVWDCYVPRPNLSNVAIMADPRLQLGDVVRLYDPDTTGVDEYAQIFGYTLNLTDWSQTIDARAVAAPGGLILDVAGRSELNTAAAYLPG